MTTGIDNFEKALECAKDFVNFESLAGALHLHPEWITVIPRDRKWAILHQLVFSGNISFLSQMLALQSKNPKFNPLVKTRDDKTILDVAKLRTDEPVVVKYVEKLMTLDRMLTYARDGEWTKCMDIVRANPSYLNEKTPYRRYYVIHHIAYFGKKDVYDQFEKIPNCHFACFLRADNKTVVEIAIEHGHPEFAEYMKKKHPMLLEEIKEHTPVRGRENTAEGKNRSESVALMMQQSGFLTSLDEEVSRVVPQLNRRAVIKKLKETEEEEIKKLREASTPIEPYQSDAASSTVPSTIDTKILTSVLICPLTMEIFRDPVFAADGVTYERSAITDHLKTHDRSPQTNEILANKELRTNTAIKKILDLFAQGMNKK